MIPAPLAAALDALGLPAPRPTAVPAYALSASRHAALTGISAGWKPSHPKEEPPF